ncbi:TPA: peptidase M23, partial [bacterium]|nr:peptidase M23 [bacterium]
RISSPYGYRRHPISGKIMFHRGLDIASPLGTSIHSVLSGVVSFSGRRGGYGNLVEIRHSNGIVTRYG